MLMNSSNNIIIFGASTGGLNTMIYVRKVFNVMCFADNDKNKYGNILHNKIVINPKEILQTNPDFVLIASCYSNQIFKQLTLLGVPDSKIIVVDNYIVCGHFKGHNICTLILILSILLLAAITTYIFLS